MLDPLKTVLEAETRAQRNDLIKALLHSRNLPLREAPAPNFGLIAFDDSVYQVSFRFSENPWGL